MVEMNVVNDFLEGKYHRRFRVTESSIILHGITSEDASCYNLKTRPSPDIPYTDDCLEVLIDPS